MSEQLTDAEQPRPADLPAVSRLAAGNGLRERLKNRAGLEPIAIAAAQYMRDHFEADAAAITLLKGDWFRTLATAGDPVPGQRRHVDGAAYPTRMYPTIVETLRDGRGYLASMGSDGGVPESQRFLKQYKKSTCMGAPIGYGGEIVGEVFVSRITGRPHYTGHDLAALLDLARQIGYRIGPAVKAQDTLDEQWWPGELRESGVYPGDMTDLNALTALTEPVIGDAVTDRQLTGVRPGRLEPSPHAAH